MGDKLKRKIKSKAEKLSAESHDRSAKGLSSTLGDVLHRKSTKATSSPLAEDGSPNLAPVTSEPRVLHGHTLTKGTTFREICYAIRDSAFVVSDLPVVVSLEVHACLEQQQTMVDIIQEAWKGLLVEVPLVADPEKLPTLAELKRKILIKAKSIPLNGDGDASEEISPQPTDELDSKTVEEQPQKPSKPSKVLEALAKLAVYTRAYHFSRFDQPGMVIFFS